MKPALIGKEELRFLLFNFIVVSIEVTLAIYFGEMPKFTGFSNESKP